MLIKVLLYYKIVNKLSLAFLFLLFFLVILFEPLFVQPDAEILGWLKYQDEILLATPFELALVVPTSSRPLGVFPVARVKEVLVEPGENVKKNQAVILLENQLSKVFLEKAEANLRLVEARQKLFEEKKDAIEDKLSEVAKGEDKLREAERDAKSFFKKGRSKAKEALSDVGEKLAKVSEGKEKLQAFLKEIEKGISQLEKQIEQVKQLPDSDPTKAILLEQLHQKLNELLVKRETLNKQLVELENGEKALKSAQKKIRVNLQKGGVKYQAGLRKIAAARAKLRKAESQLYEAQEKIDFQLSLFPFYLKQASALKRLASVVLESVQVRAPQAGKVVEIKVKPGEVVYPGQVLAVVVNDEKLFFEGYLPVKNGVSGFAGNYRVKIDSFTGRYFLAHLFALSFQEEFAGTSVITQENELTRVRKLVLEVNNSSGLLKAGFPAEAVFEERKK